MKPLELSLFDCNAMLGRSRENQGASLDDVAALRFHMARYCIDKSLVYGAIAKGNSPKIGNEHLLNMVRGEEKIVPGLVVLPNHTGEFLDGIQLREQMVKEKVGAVRLCPNLHAYALKAWCCGELLSVLNDMRMPTFLDFDVQHWSEPLPWDDIHGLCTAFPDIPFVLVRVGCGANRNLFPLLDKCPNLHFEISYYAATRGLEGVAERFGAKRMLFGTHAPVFAPSCPIGMLYYSALSDGEKQKIASGNLEQLIGGIRYEA